MSQSTFRNCIRIAIGLLVLEVLASHIILHYRLQRLEHAMGADTLEIDNTPPPPANDPAPAPIRQRRPFTFDAGSI